MKVKVNGKEINAKHVGLSGYYPSVSKKRKGTNRYSVTIVFETDIELSGYEQECMGRFAKSAFNFFGEEVTQ